jgi:hypothetical protein
MLVTDKPEDTPSTNALDNPNKRPIQGALIEAAWVKFAGTSHIALEDPPELDEGRTYIVKATCRKVETTLRKDNEERHAVVMEIDTIYEQGKVPIVDEKQPSLFEAEDGEGPGILRSVPDDESDDEDYGDEDGDEDGEPEVDRPGFSDADE